MESSSLELSLPGQGRLAERITLALPTQRGAYMIRVQLKGEGDQIRDQEELAFGVIPSRERTPVKEDSPFGNHAGFPFSVGTTPL